MPLSSVFLGENDKKTASSLHMLRGCIVWYLVSYLIQRCAHVFGIEAYLMLVPSRSKVYRDTLLRFPVIPYENKQNFVSPVLSHRTDCNLLAIPNKALDSFDDTVFFQYN